MHSHFSSQCIISETFGLGKQWAVSKECSHVTRFSSLISRLLLNSVSVSQFLILFVAQLTLFLNRGDKKKHIFGIGLKFNSNLFCHYHPHIFLLLLVMFLQAVKLGSTVNESVLKPTASKVCTGKELKSPITVCPRWAAFDVLLSLIQYIPITLFWKSWNGKEESFFQSLKSGQPYHEFGSTHEANLVPCWKTPHTKCIGCKTSMVFLNVRGVSFLSWITHLTHPV